MSFDTATGDLWLGNVGQDLWEQIFLIVRGGNYGWSVMEGSHPFRPDRQRGPTPFVPPVVEHNHTEFRSITGGCVYHGSRLKELRGSYIYGDYDTGKVWMLRGPRTSVRTRPPQGTRVGTLANPECQISHVLPTMSAHYRDVLHASKSQDQEACYPRPK